MDLPEDFRLRVREAATWGALKGDFGDPKGSLRTHALIYPEPVDLKLLDVDPEDLSRLCETVCERRRLALLEMGVRADDSRLDSGRLLVMFCEETLFDGAAEVESQGLFDVDNYPPWDTWVAITRHPSRGAILIAWIPNDLVAFAASGIEANPEQCLVWWSDVAPERTRLHLS